MPALQSCRVDENGVTLASHGKTFTITSTTVRSQYQAAAGNATTRKAAVVAALKAAIVTAIGPEFIDPAEIFFEFDPANGRPIEFGMRKVEA
jgi:hypothetical protein